MKTSFWSKTYVFLWEFILIYFCIFMKTNSLQNLSQTIKLKLETSLYKAVDRRIVWNKWRWWVWKYQCRNLSYWSWDEVGASGHPCIFLKIVSYMTNGYLFLFWKDLFSYLIVIYLIISFIQHLFVKKPRKACLTLHFSNFMQKFC